MPIIKIRNTVADPINSKFLSNSLKLGDLNKLFE